MTTRQTVNIFLIATADHRCYGYATVQASIQDIMVTLIETRIGERQFAQQVFGVGIDPGIIEDEIRLHLVE